MFTFDILLMEDWTEKYRPKTLDRVIGNERSISEIKKWADQWKENIPKRRALILSGNPGIGKTSCALALAKDYGWTSIELNASDARNATNIRNIVTLGSVNETFDNEGNYSSFKKGGKKLIILDEADNLYEKIKKVNVNELDDRGGKKAIIDTIKITKQPIILTVNDYYSLIRGGGENLKSLCKHIKFFNPYSSAISNMLKGICNSESINFDNNVLKTISDRCDGDIRSAINDLQSICMNKKYIDSQSLGVLGYRDKKKIVFDALRDIFKTRDIKHIRENTLSLDIDPNSMILWINENIPLEYIDYNDLVKGYEALSAADVFLGRTIKRQNFDLWSYACDMMNGGVASAKTHDYPNEKYRFPLWLRELKDSKSQRELIKSIVKKINSFCHNSSYKTRNFLFDYFIPLVRNDVDFAAIMTDNFKFKENDLKFLLGKIYFDKFIDYVNLNKSTSISTLDSIKIEKDKKAKGKIENKQQSILDF